MSWDRECDTVTFTCDTCPTTLAVDGNVARCDSTREASASTFMICWDVARATGWVSFKRTGQPWSYHCPACAAQAERDHQEHYRHEQERERIKLRNERY
jgi:hypothetical protein